jgi:transcriptional regulator of arginine metabolism
VATNVRLHNAMADSILYVDYSLNNVVIKTYPGLAQAVASSIDTLNMHSILGCVAGDDTIIIITRDEESSAELSQTLTDLMKTF